MKYLQILNLVLLALGAALATVLAVVCLQYAVFLDEAPRLRGDLPGLLTVTVLCAALAVAGALTYFAHRRRWMLRWLLQALPVVPLLGLTLFFMGLRA